MTSPRLLLAAGSAAAALAGVVPAISHGTVANPLRLTPGSSTTLVVPTGVTQLTAEVTGSPALARRTRVTVTRAADGALLFTGSLATFRRLPVTAGDKLVVHAAERHGFAGLRAASQLGWL